MPSVCKLALNLTDAQNSRSLVLFGSIQDRFREPGKETDLGDLDKPGKLYVKLNGSLRHQ